MIAENQLYDVDDRSLSYIPNGTCVELANPDEKVCVVDGKFIRNACQAAGAKEYTEDKGICLGCPDNKVFFDAKCMTIKEAEQKCKNSGGDFEKKTMNSKPYALCECDYTLSALYDVSCTTKANLEKWGPLMWYAEKKHPFGCFFYISLGIFNPIKSSNFSNASRAVFTTVKRVARTSAGTSSRNIGQL